jgi:hypothetical protein
VYAPVVPEHRNGNRKKRYQQWEDGQECHTIASSLPTRNFVLGRPIHAGCEFILDGTRAGRIVASHALQLVGYVVGNMTVHICLLLKRRFVEVANRVASTMNLIVVVIVAISLAVANVAGGGRSAKRTRSGALLSFGPDIVKVMCCSRGWSSGCLREAAVDTVYILDIIEL